MVKGIKAEVARDAKAKKAAAKLVRFSPEASPRKRSLSPVTADSLAVLHRDCKALRTSIDRWLHWLSRLPDPEDRSILSYCIARGVNKRLKEALKIWSDNLPSLSTGTSIARCVRTMRHAVMTKRSRVYIAAWRAILKPKDSWLSPLAMKALIEGMAQRRDIKQLSSGMRMLARQRSRTLCHAAASLGHLARMQSAFARLSTFARARRKSMTPKQLKQDRAVRRCCRKAHLQRLADAIKVWSENAWLRLLSKVWNHVTLPLREVKVALKAWRSASDVAAYQASARLRGTIRGVERCLTRWRSFVRAPRTWRRWAGVLEGRERLASHNAWLEEEVRWASPAAGAGKVRARRVWAVNARGRWQSARLSLEAEAREVLVS